MKFFKFTLFWISICLVVFTARTLFGKDRLMTFPDRPSRDSRIYAPSKSKRSDDGSYRDGYIYIPPGQSVPKSSGDAASVPSSEYIPTAQSRPQTSSDAPSGGSYTYTPGAQSQPQSRDEAPAGDSFTYTPVTRPQTESSADAPIGDSSISAAPDESSPQSSGDTYIRGDNKSKRRGWKDPRKPKFTKDSKELKVNDIAYSKDDSFVIIGGNLYGLNSIVAGGEIVEILPGKVIIKFGSKKKTFRRNDIIK